MVGLLGGASAFALMVALPAPTGLDPSGWRVAALAVLMAVWWMTEALPVAATALLPIAALPALGVTAISTATAPYAHPLVFLFLGGFLIALAVQRWGLHRRIALGVLRLAGSRQDRLVGAFMVACAFLSMWVSNTATTIMMLPIALSVVGALGSEDSPFPVALLLALAYAASIGGLGTLVGSPPNALLAGFVEQTYGLTIGFGQWMLVGIPVVVVMLVLTWVLLTRWLLPVGHDEVAGAREHFGALAEELGPMSRGEWLVAAVFTAAALLWVGRPLFEGLLPPGTVSDTGIAMACAIALFVIPVDPSRGEFLLDWSSAEHLPWGVLLLFGGGLSLAGAIASTGLAQWLGAALDVLGGWPTVALVAGVGTLVIFLTELTSNTATTAAFLPVVAALATALGVPPMVLLVPAAIAASCAFMMPVATPPNAIVYGSGHLTIAQMVRTGLWLNVVGVVAVTALACTLVPLVF
jgi:sodium-dependent dicarboxylate transporter 2/3/5